MITIDATDLLEFAADCERAAGMVPQVLHDVAFEAGILVQQKAVINVMPHRKTGTLETNIGPPIVTMSATRARAEVAATAVSAAGFPYPIPLEEGRGPIVAKPGKLLAFQGDDGTMVFTKRVKGFTGIKFMQRALDDSKPEIDATVQEAADRLLREIGG